MNQQKQLNHDQFNISVSYYVDDCSRLALIVCDLESYEYGHVHLCFVSLLLDNSNFYILECHSTVTFLHIDEHIFCKGTRYCLIIIPFSSLYYERLLYLF